MTVISKICMVWFKSELRYNNVNKWREDYNVFKKQKENHIFQKNAADSAIHDIGNRVLLLSSLWLGICFFWL